MASESSSSAGDGGGSAAGGSGKKSAFGAAFEKYAPEVLQHLVEWLKTKIVDGALLSLLNALCGFFDEVFSGADARRLDGISATFRLRYQGVSDELGRFCSTLGGRLASAAADGNDRLQATVWEISNEAKALMFSIERFVSDKDVALGARPSWRVPRIFKGILVGAGAVVLAGSIALGAGGVTVPAAWAAITSGAAAAEVAGGAAVAGTGGAFGGLWVGVNSWDARQRWDAAAAELHEMERQLRRLAAEAGVDIIFHDKAGFRRADEPRRGS